jgi:hypothetical protein
LKKKQIYQVLFIDNDVLILYNFVRINNLIEWVDSRSLEEKESFHFAQTICVVNTTDVLTATTTAKTIDQALEEAFPAFKKTDLYIDFQYSNSNSIAIIKKDKLDVVLKKHQVISLNPLQIRLGTTVCAVEEGLDHSDLSHSKIAELAVVSFITEQPYENNLDGLAVRFRESRTNKRIFEITKWSAILVFLVGLLVNFYFHEHYRKELGMIQQQQVSIKELDEGIERLSNKIKTKEYLLQSNNSSDIDLLRYLNNHLAATGNVLLEELTYQPTRSSIENNEELKLHENRVKIIGKATTKKDFNTYVIHLEQLNSIQKVEILSVEETSRTIAFELQIQLGDEIR